jgi:hypothetical protein
MYFCHRRPGTLRKLVNFRLPRGSNFSLAVDKSRSGTVADYRSTPRRSLPLTTEARPRSAAHSVSPTMRFSGVHPGGRLDADMRASATPQSQFHQGVRPLAPTRARTSHHGGHQISTRCTAMLGRWLISAPNPVTACFSPAGPINCDCQPELSPSANLTSNLRAVHRLRLGNLACPRASPGL